MSLPRALAGPCVPGIYIVHVHDRHAHVRELTCVHNVLCGFNDRDGGNLVLLGRGRAPV